MIRKYPNIHGLVPTNVELEIRNTFDYIYSLLELGEQRGGFSLDVNKEASPSSTRTKTNQTRNQSSSAVGLSNEVYGQSVVGIGQDRNVEGLVPRDTLSSDMQKTVGVFASDGFIIIKDKKGNSTKVMTAA